MKNQKQNQLVIISVIVIVFVIAIVAGIIHVNTKRLTGGELEKVTIILDWTPNTNHSGIYLAKEKGFYRDFGIDLEIQQPPEDGATPLVSAGKADFGIDYQEYLEPAVEKGANVSVVASILQNNTSCLISKKEKNITRPKDLEGKKVAWDGYDVSKKEFEYIIKKDGGDPNKVDWVELMTPNIVATLNTDIDVVSGVYFGWEGVETQLANIETNTIFIKDYDEALNFYSPVIIMNKDFGKNKTALMKNFLNATRQGYELAAEYPEKAVDALLKNVPELDGELTRKSQEYVSKEYISQSGSWGHIDNLRWAESTNWMVKEHILDAYPKDDQSALYYEYNEPS